MNLGGESGMRRHPTDILQGEQNLPVGPDNVDRRSSGRNERPCETPWNVRSLPFNTFCGGFFTSLSLICVRLSREIGKNCVAKRLCGIKNSILTALPKYR
jgi:hypothetical protein